MDAAGVKDIKEQCLKGYKVQFKTFKVHLDGYNVMPHVRGEAKEWPRKEFFYWTDDANLAAMRYDGAETRKYSGEARGQEAVVTRVKNKAARKPNSVKR